MHEIINGMSGTILSFKVDSVVVIVYLKVEKKTSRGKN